MGKYKLIIFDLDGTILDTLEDLTDSVNYALDKFGYPERTIDEVRAFVGNGIYKLIERAVPLNTGKEDIQRVFSAFDCHYKLNNSHKTKPYHGIVRLIDKLKEKGMLLAVVSNKAQPAVTALCNNYFKGKFDVVFGEREGIPKKPSPQAVNEVISLLDVLPEQTLYVGDSDVDILTAKNAGIDLCTVTWGFRTKEFLFKMGGKLFADSTEQLEEIIYC